jgi:hypothetical protein
VDLTQLFSPRKGPVGIEIFYQERARVQRTGPFIVRWPSLPARFASSIIEGHKLFNIRVPRNRGMKLVDTLFAQDVATAELMLRLKGAAKNTHGYLELA